MERDPELKNKDEKTVLAILIAKIRNTQRFVSLEPIGRLLTFSFDLNRTSQLEMEVRIFRQNFLSIRANVDFQRTAR